ncbi:hypothetical protein [Schlesneria sp. DSM 10557]|uniref:hypothetical protein n=1 Tax=Schlesneria sp. DSM 10557 TaxID=3044399 RepID=UPI0035A14EE9
MKANYMPSTWKGVALSPGQFVTGRNSASDQLGISPSKWYRGIQRLVDLGCITVEANSVWTTISVCNWTTYQSGDGTERTADEQPMNSRWTANEQRMNTVLERKKARRLEGENKETPPSPQGGEASTSPEVQDLVDEWNATDGVVQCRSLTDKRRKLIITRTRDPSWDWRAALRKFPLRCFADGGWRPDLDWLLRPDSVLSILEGKYDWDKQPTASKDDLFGSLRRFAKEQQKPTGRFTGFEIEKDLEGLIFVDNGEPK